MVLNNLSTYKWKLTPESWNIWCTLESYKESKTIILKLNNIVCTISNNIHLYLSIKKLCRWRKSCTFGWFLSIIFVSCFPYDILLKISQNNRLKVWALNIKYYALPWKYFSSKIQVKIDFPFLQNSITQ